MIYHNVLLIVHLLAMALGIGITFSNLINFRLLKSNTGDVAKGLNLQRGALHRYTDIAFVAIIVSGGLLLANLGSVANMWFHIKMAAVLVYIAGYVFARFTVMKIQTTGNTALVPRVKMAAHIAISGAVLAVICAVMTFG
jgi:uncharacterized membrane protein